MFELRLWCRESAPEKSEFRAYELQQRKRTMIFDSSGKFCGLTEWSEWHAIPEVYADEKEDSEP